MNLFDTAPIPPQQVLTEVITDTNAFAQLREEWTSLLQTSSCNSLFVTWEWMFTWWEYLRGDRKLHIVTVRKDGLLIAVAPLSISRSNLIRLKPFRCLEFLASGTVGSDYLSFLIRSGFEDVALTALTDCFTKANLALELTRIESTSFSMVAMALEMKQLGWYPMRTSTNFCPNIDLRGHTWESYCDSITASHRRDIRKKRAMLHKTFSVRFEVVSNEAQRRETMETFISLHLARWEQDGGSNALDSEELRNFHRALSERVLTLGWLRMYTLWLDDRPASVVYLFRYDDVFYYYQASFESDFSKYGVGMLTLSMAIEAAIAEGGREFDLLHDDDPYKYLWARQERELVRLDLFPPRYAGMAYRNTAIARSGIKRALLRFSESAQ